MVGKWVGRRLGGWVGLGGEETGESVSDGMQPDGLMVLHVVQQVWTCGGGWRLCRLCRTGYQGSQLKGKAPCRKSRHQQLDGGAASPCVGEAMIPLGCATQLNPPPTTTTTLLHPPKIPHYLARAHPEPTVQLSVSRRGNYTPAETQEEAYRGAHTTRRRPCDRQAAARRRYYPQRVDCWNFFSSLDDSHSKKKKRGCRSFLTVSNFFFFFFFSYSCTVSCFILYWAANTRSFINA